MGIIIIGIRQADITLVGRRRSFFWVRRMITRRLPELFLTSGLNGQSVEIRCYPTSSQVSRECSCILPP